MPKGDTWIGDPFTGLGQFSTAGLITDNVSLDDLYGNRFYVSGGAFIDRYDPTNPITLGRQGGVSVTELGGGRFTVTSEIALSGINRPLSFGPVLLPTGETITGPKNELIRRVSGTVEAMVNGESVSLTIAPTAVGKIGRQWVKQLVGPDEYAYSQTSGPFRNNAQVMAALGADYSLASPRETATAAILSALIRDNGKILQDVIEEQGIEGTADQDAEYLAALYVLKNASALNLRAFSNFYIE